jgi:hypothetical protein
MNELQLSITHLRQVCTFPSRNAARSKEALPRRGKVRWNEGSMGTSELRHARTLHGDAVCIRYIHPVRRPTIPPRVAHWMPAGSTLVPCRAGTRELATVARDVHAARNPQHHTVDTQASAEVRWFYEGGSRTCSTRGSAHARTAQTRARVRCWAFPPPPPPISVSAPTRYVHLQPTSRTFRAK